MTANFSSNQALLDGIANVKENNSDLHLYGLLWMVVYTPYYTSVWSYKGLPEGQA